MQKSGVVEAFVGIGELLEGVFGVGIAIGSVSRKLVCHSQTQDTQRELMAGLRGQHILANGLGLFRLVQKTIYLCFGKSSLDAFGRNRFQFEIHMPLLSLKIL